MPLRSIPFLLMAVALVACGRPADLVLTNAEIYTMSWPDPDSEGTPAAAAPYDASTGWRHDAEALAIRDGEILWVGPAEGVARYVGRGTRTIDLAGATVLPGLIESHAHAVELGQSLDEVDLTGAKTEEEAVTRIAERAETVPAGEWILAHGWDEGAWADRYPTMERLDEAVPDHPVLAGGLHGFAVWGNRRAFEAAGIDRDTPTPSGGEILRDADGEPTGVLTNRATKLLRDAVPPPSTEDLERWILTGLAELARAGYVAVHEAGVPEETLAALQRLDERGALPIHVYAMLSAREPALMEEWMAKGPRPAAPRSRLGIRSVKAYYDGALGSRGARLLADYSDRPGHRGVAGSEYEFDAQRVRGMMAAGFQVGIHAIGDAGNRDVLDFIESVYADHPEARAGRHRIEHAQVLHPDDIDRFAPLALIASMQPPHAMEDKAWAAERLGPERLKGAYAWRSLRRAGARLAFNSDLPGSDHDPFYGLHSAITRQDRQGRPAGGWYPEQRMTVEEAIRAYTAWGAYAAFDETRTGVIAKGYRADLTVLSVDPFTTGDARLLEGEVLATIVEGEVVYDRSEQREP